ncbi:serine hydrolase [Paludisphaera rhizosphaerae]|uniref:hypothetical protein n=1 Tax=Paludisphaera rhizosphaerae TaxID=2711216 RepID=UPI0013E9B7BB|nr:hypothetical protein [Paludisphaera rhizosphaerae]
MLKTTWTATLAAILTTTIATAAEDPMKALAPIIQDLGSGVRVGVLVEVVPHEIAAYRKDAGLTLPTASSIKTAIMIELFAKFPKALDAPAPGLDEILKDEHPAVAHFDAKQRDEIRAGLKGASVRRIGRVLLGSEDASNIVYNAACNVAIALLGGPDETTAAIHRRDPAFLPIMVRRYMLTDRKVRGDNEATAESLAAVLARLASRTVPNLDPATAEACRTALTTGDDPAIGRRHSKGGSLDTLPITRVASGWYDRDGKAPIVYVVMIAKGDSGAATPEEAGAKMEAAADKIALEIVTFFAKGDAKP